MTEVERNALYVTRQQAQIVTGRTNSKLYRQIAEDMRVSVGTVSKQLNRLRQQVDRCEATLDLFEADEWSHEDVEPTWLSKEEGRTLYLFEAEDMSYRDIAKKLGVSESTVGTRLQRAREKRDKSQRTLDVLDVAVIDIDDEPKAEDARHLADRRAGDSR